MRVCKNRIKQCGNIKPSKILVLVYYMYLLACSVAIFAGIPLGLDGSAENLDLHYFVAARL